MTSHVQYLASAIRAEVLRQGWADCSVVRQTIPERYAIENSDGEWFLLSVRYRDHSEWQLWGRRRTMQELLELAKRGPLSKVGIA